MIAALLVPLAITIHVDAVVRSDADRFFGIDLNYIRDLDSNRPGAKPLNLALTEMGVRWLRYPGGEKSNYYLWSEPPFEKPHPRSIGWYATPKGDRMDFDEFVRHAKALHAEPLVVVGYNLEAQAGRTKDQWLESAVAWVRYSKVHHCGVRYWEVGNENWHNGLGAPSELGAIVVQFAKAMKSADPDIFVGASGDSDSWWKGFLPIAAPYIDFLTVSQYTGWDWGGYDRFLTNPDLTGASNTAAAAIDRYAQPPDQARLRVIVAETNTKDYASNRWPDNDDIGHALVTFTTLGHIALQSKVRAALVWTTRWMTDSDAPSSQFYALGPQNELTATGEALRAWGSFIKPLLLRTDGTDADIEAFAARSEDGLKMSVWLVNKSRSPRQARLTVDGPTYEGVSGDRLSGSGEGERSPKWQHLRLAELKDGVFLLPPVSLTVLSLTHSSGPLKQRLTDREGNLDQ